MTPKQQTKRQTIVAAQIRRADVKHDDRIVNRFKLRAQNGQLKKSNCVQITKLIQMRKANNYAAK